jgi:hypothetical protein
MPPPAWTRRVVVDAHRRLLFVPTAREHTSVRRSLRRLGITFASHSHRSVVLGSDADLRFVLLFLGGGEMCDALEEPPPPCPPCAPCAPCATTAPPRALPPRALPPPLQTWDATALQRIEDAVATVAALEAQIRGRTPAPS